MSLFDRSTWCGARLAGGPEEDKSETFVAQARTLLDNIQVRSHTLHSKTASGCRCVSDKVLEASGVGVIGAACPVRFWRLRAPNTSDHLGHLSDSLLQGLPPTKQWHEVNDACIKRYVGCLKRLAGKVRIFFSAFGIRW